MDNHPHKIMVAGVLNLDDFPDIILEKILMHLPLRDAAKTSILSKKWNNHWRNIPALVFDDSFTRSDSVSRYRSKRRLSFLLHLSQVLLNHRGPIHKFSLSFNSHGCSEIDNVMLFLRDKDVHEFTFKLLSHIESPYKMPSCLFAYQQLQHLDLSSCEFVAPPTFEGFPHLISLHFYDVYFSVECSTFISKCPLLELLSIYECCDILRLKIDAPKLKSFSIFGGVESFFLNNTPLLSSVEIQYFYDFGNAGEGLTSKLIRFFECLPVVEYLRIEEFDFTAEEKLLTSLRIPITISHLKVLEVGYVYHTPDLSVVLAMIINSPNLQKLKLEVRGMLGASDSDMLKLIERENLSDVTFQKLQDLEMKNLFGSSVELELIKFMLAKSVVLETLTLSARFTPEQDISMAVAKFVRASPNVNIVIL